MKQYNYKVVGVTFPARDGSDRQTTLETIFKEDLEVEGFLRGHDIKFEGYDFQGKDALAVFVDGKEIGNIAAEKVNEVAEIAQKASKCTITLAVNGHDLDDYEYIVDRYKNKKDWKDSDPYYDFEEAKEEYNELMEDLKGDDIIYSAVLHLFVEEESDKSVPVDTNHAKTKRVYSKRYYIIMLVLCILLVIMGLLLTLVMPVIGLLAVVAGIFGIVWARKGIKQLKTQ